LSSSARRPLDLHLLDRFDRIIGADDVVADAILEVTVDLHVEGHLLLGAAVAFRQSQRIAQGLVVGHRHPQGEGLVRHGAQLVAVEVRQLALI
jgi:hypothetical protein